MSLYNLVHGVNSLAGYLLGLLGLSTTATSTGRFRDCYLQRNPNGVLEIHVFTRNGGGNRPDFVAVTNALRAHPHLIRDADESHDSTYAVYVFGVPMQALTRLESLVAAEPTTIPKSPSERFQEMLTKIQTQPDDPEVQRIKTALAPTFEAINKAPPGSVVAVMDDHIKGPDDPGNLES